MTITRAKIASDVYTLAKNIGKASIAGGVIAAPLAGVTDAGLSVVGVGFLTGAIGWLAFIYDIRPASLGRTKE